uniref:Uncharacterized protein n=1 Tax=Caenorhabditis japonica TaxID=281687 RepID=A0A8R1EFU1_CAEJA
MKLGTTDGWDMEQPKVLPNIVATDPSTSDSSSKHKPKSVDEDEKMEVDGDEKYSERPVFHNQFSTLLHHHYHITPGGQTEWHSAYWEQEERRRFEQIRLNVNSYRHLICENIENKSFVAPYGTLSPFFAHRFYELLAMPPLDTEIITVHIARRRAETKSDDDDEEEEEGVMDEEKEIELPVKKPRIEEVEKIDNSRYMNDGSHSEFSTARFVEVFRNEERKQRKAMLFRTRFKNFDMCSLTSGLTLEDAEWTHISGEFVQRRQITGKSYPPDQHNFNPFNAEIFLGLTSELISASGGGHSPPKDVTEFVFKRTMKTLMNYCNWMYRLAKFKNKRLVSRVSEKIA